MSMGLACSLTRLYAVDCCGANADAAARQSGSSTRCIALNVVGRSAEKNDVSEARWEKPAVVSPTREPRHRSADPSLRTMTDAQGQQTRRKHGGFCFSTTRQRAKRANTNKKHQLTPSPTFADSYTCIVIPQEAPSQNARAAAPRNSAETPSSRTASSTMRDEDPPTSMCI